MYLFPKLSGSRDLRPVEFVAVCDSMANVISEVCKRCACINVAVYSETFVTDNCALKLLKYVTCVRVCLSV